MANTLSVADWLSVIDADYLASFIARGGAAIKFAVEMEDGVGADVIAELSRRGMPMSIITVPIDATQTKVHMIDQVFFAIAHDFPWQESVRRVVERLAHEAGYSVDDEADGPLYERMAQTARVDADLVLLELKRRIGEGVLKNRRLAKDFRIAMTQLALADLVGGPEGAMTFETIIGWLNGTTRTIGAVKRYQIFTRINRGNARYMFESLCEWVGVAGYAGLIVVVDIRRLTVARNPRDELIYYTKASVLDAYEVLRQFIDGLDMLERCLIVVVASQEFLDEDPLSRGFGAYQALKFRVYDEVRDRLLSNPLASLIRLTASEERPA